MTISRADRKKKLRDRVIILMLIAGLAVPLPVAAAQTGEPAVERPGSAADAKGLAGQGYGLSGGSAADARGLAGPGYGLPGGSAAEAAASFMLALDPAGTQAAEQVGTGYGDEITGEGSGGSTSGVTGEGSGGTDGNTSGVTGEGSGASAGEGESGSTGGTAGEASGSSTGEGENGTTDGTAGGGSGDSIGEEPDGSTDENADTTPGEEEPEPVQTIPNKPKKLQIKRGEKTTVISWKQTGDASGYKLVYADNRLFLKSTTVKIKDPEQMSCEIEIPEDKRIYVKIRTWNKVSPAPDDPEVQTETYWSDWVFSNNVTSNKTASIRRLKKSSGSKLDLRKVARQKVYGYDTVQGSCYGKGYMYYILYNRDVDRCKIVKMKLSNKKIVKVSPSKKVYHGNDLTYNTDTNRLIIAHADPDGKKLSVVDPKSLKIQKTVKVNLPKKLPGLTDVKANIKRLNKLGGYAGFASIAYNAKYDEYVVQVYKVRDYMILDSSFKPVRYIHPSKRDSQQYQGLDSYGDFIIQSSSFSTGKPYNILTIFDWEGKYLAKITLNKGMELESVFHTGKNLYISYYRSYTKTVTKTIKVKKKFKKKIRVKVKIKKGKRKGKYKKKKKVITYWKKVDKTIRVTKLCRDGYLYRIDNM